MTDITYIRTYEGWLYLVVIIDLYSRRVIGWSMQSRSGGIGGAFTKGINNIFGGSDDSTTDTESFFSGGGEDGIGNY